MSSDTLHRMKGPFLGSGALAAGMTRHALRTRYVAVHKDVYVAENTEMTAIVRARACWLRSRGHGVLAGFSASALHGSRWIDGRRPATVIGNNRRREPGVTVWADAIGDDEICLINGMRVTTPLRTAIDLARRYPVDKSVPAIDALARATRLSVTDLRQALDRYAGWKGIKQARTAIGLVDPGAESPKETWLRLLIVRAGFPRPETQLPVYDEYGMLIGEVDLGWRDHKIAAEYEGDHHRTNRVVFRKDIRRIEALTEQGWLVIRVTALDTEGGIIRRLESAFASHS
uniref:Cullin, a subunit of E3 ubiquitin ligase n=3 Tax=Mycobacteriaceae TaxID=1762 RepID=A0A5Q5BDG4_MYCSS